ncbi:type II/IV secretion system protein [Candidatus Uhrbacteria bacterium]|nr:type II/IV secretion system protein [Candidatus Uhrbacteria bacterium]
MDNQFPRISSKEARQEFEEKMKELNLRGKEHDIEQAASRAAIPYIQLVKFPISTEALRIIPEEQARQLSVVCFFYIGDEFRIGSPRPENPALHELLYQIQERIKARGLIYMISDDSLDHALKLYAKLPRLKPSVKGVEIKAEDLANFKEEFHSFDELQARLKGAAVTDLVTLLVASALRANSSDIHIEAESAAIVVRFRIDGVLHQVAKLDKSEWPKVVSRIKLISGLKINVTDRPQDGRFTIFVKEGNVEVRVSTIPTSEGESVVIRILKPISKGLNFEELGLRGKPFERLMAEIKRPNGMIITTGPTGSGKTTTLYAALHKLNNPETKIITLEDPIEYKLPGIAQSQIDTAKHYSFAEGLRSILRQDPDVIMVGEIRDLETVDIAIQAALTGHLVLSTVHTNSASGAIPRFLALGAKPFLLAPALNAVMAQRLVRRIHEECKEEVKLEEETLKRVKEILAALPKEQSAVSSGQTESPRQSRDRQPLAALKFYRGRGCARCFDLGYKGQVGIFEVMMMNKEIEEVVLAGKISEYTLQEIAVKAGMITMVQDGLLKALDGITTVEEVFRVAE